MLGIRNSRFVSLRNSYQPPHWGFHSMQHLRRIPPKNLNAWKLSVLEFLVNLKTLLPMYSKWQDNSFFRDIKRHKVVPLKSIYAQIPMWRSWAPCAPTRTGTSSATARAGRCASRRSSTGGWGTGMGRSRRVVCLRHIKQTNWQQISNFNKKETSFAYAASARARNYRRTIQVGKNLLLT